MSAAEDYRLAGKRVDDAWETVGWNGARVRQALRASGDAALVELFDAYAESWEVATSAAMERQRLLEVMLRSRDY